MNYYNEIDPFAAAWLRGLIKAGHISQGEVDERDIQDVVPSDLRGYRQCHFFAGIGGWSYALRLAGWPDDRPVWTGSCPCQPFSAAGKRGGTADERHLWPTFYHLISQCRPLVVFGEQVASKDGLAWLDTVQADLEGAGYACGAADTCAAGFGAPHIRQRLYFVAHSCGERRQQERGSAFSYEAADGREGWNGSQSNYDYIPGSECKAGGMANAPSVGLLGRGKCYGGPPRVQTSFGRYEGSQIKESRLTRGFWGNAEWIECLDSRKRPVEPGTFPLAHGAANRVGRLRGYGNAIVAPQAAAFISAAMECLFHAPVTGGC